MAMYLTGCRGRERDETQGRAKVARVRDENIRGAQCTAEGRKVEYIYIAIFKAPYCALIFSQVGSN